MRILKTAQFDHHSHLVGDEGDIGHVDGDGSGLDDMMIDDQSAEVHPHDGGASVELEGHGHMGGDQGGESLGDLIHGLGAEEHNPEDLEVSMHLDAPNDLAGDLPADVDIDPQAFGESGEQADDIGHEGSFAEDGQNDQNFNDLSLDGELDGSLNLDETNGARPDGEKEDLAGNHFDTQDEDHMPTDDQNFGDEGWSHDFLGHGGEHEGDEMPVDIDLDFDGQSMHLDGEHEEGGHGGGGGGYGWGSSLGDPDAEVGLGNSGFGFGHRGIYTHLNDDGGEVGEIDDIGDPSGLDPRRPQFGDGEDSHMDRSKPHKHPKDNFDDFIQ